MGAIRSLIFGPDRGDVGELKAKYGPPPSQFIRLSNGVNVHLRDEGDPDAPPIVLVHGHTEDLHTWNHIVKNLIESFRVIRFDLRRHGLTGPAPDNDYRIENYVSDLSLIVDHIGIDSFVLVGHSMGGESRPDTPWRNRRGSTTWYSCLRVERRSRKRAHRPHGAQSNEESIRTFLDKTHLV